MHDQILTGTIGIFLAIHGVAAASASACVLRDTAPAVRDRPRRVRSWPWYRKRPAAGNLFLALPV